MMIPLVGNFVGGTMACGEFPAMLVMTGMRLRVAYYLIQIANDKKQEIKATGKSRKK